MIGRLGDAGRLAATALGWAALTATLALLAALAAPRLAGGQSYAVLSDSMRGTVDTGDQVVVLPQPAGEIEPGQIVAFDDPAGSGRLLQHRAQRVDRRGDEIEVTTMGDANTAAERWSVPADGEVGRVVAVVPAAGHLLGRLGAPLARVGLILVSTASLALLALLAIWGPSRKPPAILRGEHQPDETGERDGSGAPSPYELPWSTGRGHRA